MSTPLANAEMADHARRLLELMILPPVDDLLAEQVQRSIRLLLPGGQATLAAVAVNLGMSTRTLQRQLMNGGYSFGRMLNDVRRDMAQHYLSGSTQMVSTVSELLGYNSVSAFSRWFGSEFGTNPSDWRSAHKRTKEGPPPIWRV